MKKRLTYRWRKVDKHLYCLHVNNGENEVAFYAHWHSQLSGNDGPTGWTLTHKAGWVGSEFSTSKLDARIKRSLEKRADRYLNTLPEAWESAVQTGPGAIVWCASDTTPEGLQTETGRLHRRGLELVQVYNHGKQRSASRWLICRMR